MPIRHLRLLAAFLIALLIAVLGAIPRIAGIETWKIVLALLGIAMIVGAGRGGSGAK